MDGTKHIHGFVAGLNFPEQAPALLLALAALSVACCLLWFALGSAAWAGPNKPRANTKGKIIGKRALRVWVKVVCMVFLIKNG
jgi:hypothetical protein